MKELYHGMFVGIIFLTLLLSNPAFAFAAENVYFEDTNSPNPIASPVTTTAEVNTGENNGGETVVNNTNPNSSGTAENIGSGYSCDVVALTPEEAKKIIDLTGDGFSGKNISDGDDTNASGTNLEGVELVGKDNDGETAIKQAPPTQAADAERYSLFDGRIVSGPFGIGLVLDDTLRVGRCEYGVDERNNCRIQGNGLNYRTDGVGFKADLVNAFDSLKDVTVRTVQGVSEEEYTKLQNNIRDDNSANFTTGTFSEGDQIKNSIWSEQYIARNATTCNNDECTISTYSAFDKYFNAWMTTDFVVSNIGPSLLHKASKIINTTKARGTWKQLSKINDALAKFRNKISLLPSQALGQKASARYADLYQSEGLGTYVKGLTIDKKLFSSGTGGWMDDALKPGSDIMKLTKEQKGKYYEAMSYLRSYTMANNAKVKGLQKQLTDETITQLEFGQEISRTFNDWDDTVFLDYPDWLKSNQDLFDLKGVSVKRIGTAPGEGFQDIETGQPFNLKRIMKKFEADGKWDGDWGKIRVDQGGVVTDTSGFEYLPNGNLQLYKLQPTHVVKADATADDVLSHISQYGEGKLYVEFPDGTKTPLTSASKDRILNDPALSGHVSLYRGEYSPARELSPDEFITKLSDDRITSRNNTAEINMTNIMRRLDEAGFKDRRYTSWLDKTFASETDMVKAYFNSPLTGGLVKGTAAPILYWNAKRGFGQEQFSAYMLPDSWTTVSVSQGQDDIYRDSYIDFYANAGSDQGDMFKRAFTALPFIWTNIIEWAAESTDFTSDKVSSLSGGFLGDRGWTNRDKVLDLAFYSHNENCAGCSMNLSMVDGYFSAVVDAPSKMQSFLVEAAEASVKQKSGTALISYAHHADFGGKTADIDGDGINIVEARDDGLTCDQKLQDLGLGFFGTSAGGILALGENIGYMVGFGPGLIASGIQQMYFARDLQDCVDDKEGYYIHFYAPPSDQQKKTKSKEVLSNESVSSAISKMSQGVDNATSKTENPIASEIEKLKDQFVDFAEQADSADILQANLELLPPNAGSLFGDEVFYIWYGGNGLVMPSALKTDGKMVTKDGNQEVEYDYSNGDMSINGEKVISDKKEIIGLVTPSDNRIPAQVIPRTVNTIGAPQTAESVFEITPSGKVNVTEAQVLGCLQSAVKAQVGITYSGNELTQVFGELTGVNTQIYGNVIVRDGEIKLEGAGQRVQGGSGSLFIIDGYWKARLQRDVNNNIDAGKFKGMTFEHGTIVLNEETNELVVWLRQHKESVLSNKEVSGLKAKLATSTDPNTGCEQPAIELEARGHANDELGQQRVENFNTSMEHLGPFTQFTTDNKVYEFYSKRDEDGVCKDYFKVIDKETGKVLTDSEIVGGIKQDEDGTLSFKTADGKNHSLDFSAENGVPKLSYNDGPLETLRTAQGTNGSFWYDPKTGLWYPENGLQVPLDNAFKEDGAYFGTDEDGKVSGTAGNPMTFNLGQSGGGGFNIPSLPETAMELAMYILLFLGVAFFITQKPIKKKKK